MRQYIEERVTEIARYIIETGETVRGAAKHFKVSKSTVHKDMSQRLLEISPKMAAEVHRVLLKNLSERHIRGGIATREMYRRRKAGDKIS